MSKSPAPRLKLVIRRLPPTLPEEIFWAAVAPFIDGKYNWRRYVKGKAGDNYGQHPVHSRAYVLMKDVDSLVAFHAAFDGHVFRSKTGAEYQAVVEYAPIEKTPFKTKSKSDHHQGTIDKDSDYLSFLASLEIVEPKQVLETSTPAPQPTSTPLLDALRAQQAKSKSKNKKEKEKDKKANGAKAAALAAISEATSKRAPKDKTVGVVMVAGKGRDVYIGPKEEMPGVASEAGPSEKKKKQRSKKKGKEVEEGGDDDAKEKERKKREKKEREREKKAKEKESKEPKEPREPREPRQPREPKEPKEPREAREPGEETSHDSKRSRGRGRKPRGEEASSRGKRTPGSGPSAGPSALGTSAPGPFAPGPAAPRSTFTTLNPHAAPMIPQSRIDM